jgi:hypothetical protein
MDVRVVVGGKSGGRTCRISGFCSGAADGDHDTKHARLAPAKIACPPERGANMALYDLRGLKNSVFLNWNGIRLGEVGVVWCAYDVQREGCSDGL